MLVRIIADPRFYAILFRIDQEIAESARRRGCACGGVLHVADYPRKPRSIRALPPEHRRRLSFTCGACRRRTTPPSVRFMGRRVFTFPLILVADALASGLRDARRAAALLSELGVDRRTFDRWRRWWRTEFADSRFWRVARARFSPPVDPACPRRLLPRFRRGALGLVDLLRFLSPLSCSSNHAL